MTETTVQTPIPKAEPDADGLSTPPEGVLTGEQENSAQSTEPKEARFRRERNEARDERDALATRIERMQRSEIERLAARAMAHPGDLFTLSGHTPADYLTDDGEVDADKVAADVAAVLAERPGLSRNAPAFDPSQGLGGDRQPAPTPTWASAFRRRN